MKVAAQSSRRCRSAHGRLSITASDVIFGGGSLEPHSPPHAFIIKPGAQVSIAEVNQRTGLAARSVWFPQVENPHLRPHFFPFFHHPGENYPH